MKVLAKIPDFFLVRMSYFVIANEGALQNGTVKASINANMDNLCRIVLLHSFKAKKV